MKQAKLSKEEVLAKFAETGLNPLYSDLFWDKYSFIYDDLDGSEDDSDWALESARCGMEWFILYKAIGHPDNWSEVAFEFGRDTFHQEFTLENMADCLYEVYNSFWPNDKVLADEELHRNCDYIAQRFKKSPIYMRFFYDWYEETSGGSELLEHFEQMEHAYNYAISKGKDDDFAYFYVTWPGRKAWHMAELRESLKKNGWDDDYVNQYLYQYEEGLLSDGNKRRHPDIPAFWEEEVTAYMRGWDYVRKHKLQHQFIKLFRDTCLILSHPNDTLIPVYIDDETVVEAMKARYSEYTLKEAGLS